MNGLPDTVIFQKGPLRELPSEAKIQERFEKARCSGLVIGLAQ
jgi:hypothetical protein